jgi:outer membrane protein assembly factor BamA
MQSKTTQKLFGTIRRTPPPDSIIKSETPFLPYEGKIIRKIIINQVGFERTIPDTSRWIKSTAAKIANRLHNDTKSWVIRNNLFLREGKPLNPYRVADNERYLRDLDFIVDSRIFVLPLTEDGDSVDLLVMTRDVFSLGAVVVPYSTDEYRFRVQESNLGGMGQKLRLTGVYDYERSPKTGYEFLYQKTNLFGSFINASIAYTEINTGRSIGEENEYGYLFRLDRPLYNPFARWTGAFELSRNWSQNNFKEEENSYYDYQYDIKDVWAGYSFGLKKLSPAPAHGENRNRTFIALRGFDQEFSKLPEKTFSYDDSLMYVDRSNVLGQLSFFKQNFYKTS